MEYIIETTKCSIGENEQFKLPKYDSIKHILDDLRTFKEIQNNETLNQILNDIIINKPTVICFQHYDIINTQRTKYKYFSKFYMNYFF